MRNLVVKVAVFGISCALCFGTVACGNEGVNDSADASMTAAKTTEAQPIEALMQDWKLVQFTVKGETTKASELPKNELETMAPRFSFSDGTHVIFHNGMKDHSGTVREENGQYIISYDDTTQGMIATVSGDKLTIVNEKGTLEFVFEVRGEDPEEVEAEAVPMIEQWDDSVVARYIASYEVTGEEIEDVLNKIGKGTAEYFTGTDYTVDVLMDLQDDGSVVIYYDYDAFIKTLEDNMSDKFNEIMIAKYEKDGTSREALEKQMLQMGFKSLEEGLDNMRVTVLEMADPALRELLNDNNMRMRLNWKEDGDKMYIVGRKDMEFNEDGSFDYTLQAAKSLTGKEYDLHFVPVNR